MRIALHLLAAAALALASSTLDLHAQEPERWPVGPLRIGTDIGAALYTTEEDITGFSGEEGAQGIAPILSIVADYRLDDGDSPWRVEMGIGYRRAAMKKTHDSRETIEVYEGGDTVAVPVDVRNDVSFYAIDITLAPTVTYNLTKALYAGAGLNIGGRVEDATMRSRKTLLTRTAAIPGRGFTEVYFTSSYDDPSSMSLPIRRVERDRAFVVGASLFLGAEFNLGGLVVGPRVGYTTGLTRYVESPAIDLASFSAVMTLRCGL